MRTRSHLATRLTTALALSVPGGGLLGLAACAAGGGSAQVAITRVLGPPATQPATQPAPAAGGQEQSTAVQQSGQVPISAQTQIEAPITTQTGDWTGLAYTSSGAVSGMVLAVVVVWLSHRREIERLRRRRATDRGGAA